jgi:hypothetical protein
MAQLTVKVDISGFVAGRRNFEEKQLPFITAKTLTDTARDAQVAVQRNVRQAFHLRNEWTVRGIRIKPADKKGNNGRIEADVHTDTENRKTGAPDYLGRQETGGTKIPFGGHEYLAVPTKYLRRMVSGVIPAELRPKALLGASGGRFQVHQRNGKAGFRSQRIVNGFVFFIQKLRGGDLAIMGRPVAERHAYPYYLLIHSAHVRRSQLDMEKTVERVVQERFARHWDQNWQALYAAGLRI